MFQGLPSQCVSTCCIGLPGKCWEEAGSVQSARHEYRLVVSAVWARLVIAVEVLAPVEIHVVGDDEKAPSYHGNGSLCHE